MRELKFRAWDVDRKFYEEVHDLYWFEENGVREQSADGTFGGHHGRYIIEQFTGLEDGHGREIYEGDILRQGVDIPCIIRWDDRHARFALFQVGKLDRLNSGFGVQNAYHYAVIGNIHENPELVAGN